MSEKIKIGVTGPDKGGLPMWLGAKLCIWLASGTAVRITPSKPLDEKIDGLLLGGGADVDSSRYGEERQEMSEEAKSWWQMKGVTNKFVSLVVMIVRRALGVASAPLIDKARDELEISLLSKAKEERLPVLGICRGEQLMNVQAGGSLHQSLSGLYQESPEIWTTLPKKEITTEAGSLLARITGQRTLLVNSMHKQGVNVIGKNLKISAKDKNSIIQAIEAQNDSFFLGVQWHPEFLPHLKEQRKIFIALIDAARKRKQKVNS